MNMNMAASPPTGLVTPAAPDQQCRPPPPIPPIVIIRKGGVGNGMPAGCQGGSLTIVKTEPPKAEASEIKKRQESADSADEDGNGAAGTSDDADFKSGRIRKRRYSMARIQPTRIKKVMQSDEEIGRMVASVPVAIGSAMEMFAVRLLQSAAEALQNSSTKTLSPFHIKRAVLSTPHFAFLRPMLADIHPPKPGQQGNQQYGNG